MTEEDFQKAATAYSDEDFATAFPLMQRCAQAGHPRACFLLALMYQAGEGTIKDEIQYKKWLNRLLELAEEGNAVAQWEMGSNYRFGNHFPLDIKRANYWLERAAESGSPDAQHHLGWYLQTGQYGYDKDVERAAYWHQKALEQGHPETLYMEALKYFHDGKPTDRAVALLRRAAENNFMPAVEVLRSFTH